MSAGTQISSTCEVLMDSNPDKFCNLPTIAGYPAMGGGWMALCAGHVTPHENYVYPIEDIRSGLADHMQEHGSRG